MATGAVIDGGEAQLFSESSTRPLAYVSRILDLQPIPGADAIEVATILGWKVVVKKGRYSVGDPCIYAEIDSILPPWPTFTADGLERAKYRIKTIKLRGQISQGYCVPIQALEDHPGRRLRVEARAAEGADPAAIVEGTGERIELTQGRDVTELLCITKYEPEAVRIPCTAFGPDGVVPFAAFPSFLHKTDQTRIQNMPWLPTEYPDVEFECSEKVDGTSITMFWRDGEFGVCTRNYRVKDEILREAEGADLAALSGQRFQTHVAATHVAARAAMRGRLGALKRNIALQGELLGPGIAKNPYKFSETRWLIFDAWLIDEARYATAGERGEILASLGVRDAVKEGKGDLVAAVPVISANSTLAGRTVEGILEEAEGKSALCASAIREGFVFKSRQLINGKVISFKAISRAFELAKG
eukprot:tig00000269_g23684.t1